jgi:hypothetical protein
MAEAIASSSGIRESARLRLEAAPIWRSLLYREPSVERVATLDRWLRANPGAWVRLYHGTDAALPVAREGLKPTGGARRNSLQSRTGYVSFSIYPGHAEVFARMAFPRRAVTIYGVDLRVGELVADRDQLRNQRAWARSDVKDTLAHSLAFGHGAQVKGRVAPERLFVVKQSPSAEQMSAEMRPRVAPRAPGLAAGMRLL